MVTHNLESTQYGNRTLHLLDGKVILDEKKVYIDLLFACRYAYKNFIHNPIRSFLLAFGFIGIFTTILIVVTMQNFF